MKYYPLYDGEDFITDIVLSPVEVLIKVAPKAMANVVICILNLVIFMGVKSMNLIIFLSKGIRNRLISLLKEGGQKKNPDSQKSQDSYQISLDYIFLTQNS